MLKLFLGVVVGVVAIMALVMGGQYVLHAVFPMPAVDMTDKAALQTLMAQAPLGAKIGLIAVYTVAAFGASWIGTRVAGRRLAGGIVTGIMLALTVANYVNLPHPIWIVVSSLVLIAGGGWLGARMAARA